MFNSRAQEAAPFELLIAVILMGFVMVMGMYAMRTLEVNKCKGETDQSISRLRIALEDVARGDEFRQSNVFFNLPKCYASTERVILASEQDSRICNRWCGGTKQSCMLLMHEYIMMDNGSPEIFATDVEPQCVNIPQTTIFSSDGMDGCPPVSGVPGYAGVTDFTDNEIPPGIYFLQRQQSAGTAPIICVYQRERS
ncbi:MAG: hypothetical protein ABH821_05930 [archaeon]